MMKTISSLVLPLTLLIPAAGAQEGHPLDGTWQGYWGATENDRNFLTLIMNWDGETITGLVNPGRDSGTIREVRFDSSTWTVEFDLEVPDGSGEPVRVMAEGRLENIGSPNRMVRGDLVNEGGGYIRISRQ